MSSWLRPSSLRSERYAALAAFATLALVMAGHAVLETARDALFLRSLPPEQLPWVYLIIAVLTFAFTGVESALARGARRRELLAFFLFASALGTCVLWAVAEFVSVASIWLLYVWTGVFGTVAMIHFWLSMGAAFTVTQAKRLFGFVGAGALVGAIAGSTLARLVISVTEARDLVLAASICMLASALAAHIALRAAPQRTNEVARAVRLRDALGVVREERYVRRIVAFVLLSTVAVTLADYLFKREVAMAIPAAELAPFFATFYATLNVIALVVQLGLVGVLLDRAGVPRTLAILPVLLLGGGIWMALGGGLAAVLFLKGSNGALRHSLHRTATEVLFVPLAARARERAKTVADVVGHRVGQALASLLILVSLWGTTPQSSLLAWCIAFVGGLTAILALRSRASYLDVFRRHLGALEPARTHRLPPLDGAALETLFAALDSPREREALASLEVFEEQGRVDLVPALILHHPSPRVARRALTAFLDAGRRDFVATALRVETEDPELRAALLRAIAAARPDEKVLREALDDPSRRVRATAIVKLTALGRLEPEEACARLDAISTDPPVRRAIAAALAITPCSALADPLRALATDEDVTVRAEAVNAMALGQSDAFFPELLSALRERALRPLARRGFTNAGEKGLGALLDALDDPATPAEIRLHIPRSIARFAPEIAAAPLWSRFARELDLRVRAKMLRALEALARRRGGLPIDRAQVSLLIRRGLARCRRLDRWRASFAAHERRTPTESVLMDLLDEELAHELEQVFRTLGLRHPGEDFRSIQRGLGSDDPVVRASCEELLSEVLPHDDRRALLELVRYGRAGPPSLDRDRSLRAIIEGRSEPLSAIAGSLAAELGYVELADRIAARACAMRTRTFRTVLERAAAELGRVHEAAHG